MFDVFRKILQNKFITETDAQKVSEFVMLRWLSGDPRLTSLVSVLNVVPTAKVVRTQQLCNAIAKTLSGQIKFIKYPKAARDGEELSRVVEQFARYFDVSLTEAQEYVEWCEARCPEEIHTMKNIFKETRDA